MKGARETRDKEGNNEMNHKTPQPPTQILSGLMADHTSGRDITSEDQPTPRQEEPSPAAALPLFLWVPGAQKRCKHHGAVKRQAESQEQSPCLLAVTLLGGEGEIIHFSVTVQGFPILPAWRMRFRHRKH